MANIDNHAQKYLSDLLIASNKAFEFVESKRDKFGSINTYSIEREFNRIIESAPFKPLILVESDSGEIVEVSAKSEFDFSFLDETTSF